MGILPDMTNGPAGGLLGGLPQWLQEALGQQQPQQPSMGTPAPGMPMPQANPFAQPPQPPQQPAAPSFGDQVGNVAGQVGGRLFNATTGFLNGHSLPNALANGITSLVTGEPTDPQAVSRQNAMAQYKSLMDAGLSPQMARMAVQNPEVMKAVIPQLVPKYESKEHGQGYGRFNSATGRYEEQGIAPKFETIPQGAAAGYATPGGFKPLVEGGGPKIEDVTGIRKEVTALPEVKRYSEALPVFRSMSESHRVDTSAADLDFVYGVAKIFDPDSVVREGEMKLVGKAQSLPEDVKGFIEGVTGGARLTPEARARILDVARIRMNELKNSVDTRLSPYKGIADRNKINQADILPQFQDLPADSFSDRFNGPNLAQPGAPGYNVQKPATGFPPPPPAAVKALRDGLMRNPQLKADFIVKFGQKAFEKAMMGGDR